MQNTAASNSEYMDAVGQPNRPAKPLLEVAVGLLLAEDQVLIAKRAKHKHQGGKWEFPGGKIEAGESPLAALARELEEEVGLTLDASVAEGLIVLNHEYEDLYIRLHCYLLPRFSGQASGLEGQEVRWVTAGQLDQYSFPAANQEIIAALLAVWPQPSVQ